MPHLDASALIDDPKGLEFLAEVIDVPADHPAPSWLAQETGSARDDVGLVAKTSAATQGKRTTFVHVAA